MQQPSSCCYLRELEHYCCVQPEVLDLGCCEYRLAFVCLMEPFCAFAECLATCTRSSQALDRRMALCWEVFASKSLLTACDESRTRYCRPRGGRYLSVSQDCALRTPSLTPSSPTQEQPGLRRTLCLVAGDGARFSLKLVGWNEPCEPSSGVAVSFIRCLTRPTVHPYLCRPQPH